MDSWEKAGERTEANLTKEAEMNARRLSTAKITEASHKRMMDYENKLIKQRRMEAILTRSVGGGGGVMGSMMNMVQNVVQAKYSGFKRLEELNKKGLGMSSSELKERNMLDTGANRPSNKIFQKLDQTFEKAFGGDSKWNKAFGGHGKLAAAGMGVGAIGGGMALGKAIIDSSPMFQQMLKLLKFGIMMILRPIGDFFGFIMRPIMILLLRKFIIPWYSKMYPQMMKWGTEIGTKLAGALEALAEGDIAGAFGAIWGEVDWGDTIWKVLKVAITPLAVGDLIFGMMGKGDNAGFNLIGQEIKKAIDDIDWTGVQTSWDKIGNNFDTWSNDVKTSWGESWTDFTNKIKTRNDEIYLSLAIGWGQITNFFNNTGKAASGWVSDRWDNVTKFFSTISGNVTNWINEKWDNFTSFFSDALGNVWNTLGYYWSKFVSFFMAIGNAGTHLANMIGIHAATGYDGMVTKPTLMMVGEAGAEHVKVTPNSQMVAGGGAGGNITINIQNMSGSQQDLNNLKQTILDVMQQSNTRRGRV